MKSHREIDPARDEVIEALDIPRSYYEKAARRYQSISKWLHREESSVSHLHPEAYLQGSFRYGTVTKGLDADGEYDIDFVIQIDQTKTEITQSDLKQTIGEELLGYSRANNMNSAPVEKKRCWRLDYADEVNFHADVIPSIPEDEFIINEIQNLGAPARFAKMAVAITDIRHPEFERLTKSWLSSNPKGLGFWFDERAQMYRPLREQKDIASVPPYDWRSPLQRTIQLLKRHRDVMFKDQPEYAPISMILTILAAQAYQGESTIKDALFTVHRAVPGLVLATHPRIPNPVNPAEDFADHWASDSRYERNFWLWYSQLTSDLRALAEARDDQGVRSVCSKAFGVNLSSKSTFEVPAIHISRGHKPWRKA